MDEESNKLLAKMELENGGKLEYRTYAQFLGKSGEGTKNLGGLLFFVGNRLIYEDFERQSSTMFLLFRKKKEYVKLKFQISTDDIERINLVNLSQGLKVVKYNKDPKNLTEISTLRRVLFRNVTQILLKDGSAYYFEIFDLKGFNTFMSLQNK
ncbi:MAG: hypothetical protein PF693_17665 [Spirochaetia bacterium]|jgi:hypothetical protein|nr:hypothetical protein [Spirochaetia bacterium]